MKLDTEMSLVERGLVVARAAVLQGEGGVVAEKINLRDTPVASVAFDPKQTLADRRHQLPPPNLPPRRVKYVMP